MGEPGEGSQISVNLELRHEAILYAGENNQTNKKTIEHKEKELRPTQRI